MILGASVYGEIFSSFISTLQLENERDQATISKHKEAINLAKILELPNPFFTKISV